MARVIRGEGTSTVVPREVFDAKEQARHILDGARSEAEGMLEVAREEATRIREDARRGGDELARAEAATILTEAAAIRDRALAEAEQEAARLALTAARRLVGEELAVSPDRIASIVGDVLARARRASSAVVCVNPVDAEALRRLSDAVVARAGGALHFSIEQDPEITRGGCVVRTNLGELDARVEVQLDALARAMGVK